MKYFCTLFDNNYLNKGKILIESLHTYSPNSLIFLLDINKTDDSKMNHLFKEETNIIYFHWIDIADAKLKKAYDNRTQTEFAWTCASWFMNFLLLTKKLPMITYLDADLMFFNKFDSIFDEIGEKDIAIIPHRFSKEYLHYIVNGEFNVSWLTIRNTVIGMQCIKRWSEQSLEWCYHRIEGDKLGDQKYLDEWPKLYKDNLCIIQNIGAGVAPWNALQYNFTKKNNSVYVDETPLVFYHYHEYKNKNYITGYPVKKDQCDLIYAPYIVLNENQHEE